MSLKPIYHKIRLYKDEEKEIIKQLMKLINTGRDDAYSYSITNRDDTNIINFSFFYKGIIDVIIYFDTNRKDVFRYKTYYGGSYEHLTKPELQTEILSLINSLYMYF